MGQIENLRTERKFKKTEVGEIPVDWDVCRLGDHAYIKARIGWRGLSASEYTEEGPLLISGNHISQTKILWDKCDHLSKFRYEESPEIKLKEGDVIVSKDGTIGRLGYIENLPQEATIGGTMMLIRPQEKLFYPKYVYYYFQGSYFQNLIKEKVSGSSIPHIFQRDIVNLRVPLIPLDEQKKIAEILFTVDKAIEKSNKLIDEKKELKKGLMQELLTRGIGHKKFKKTDIGNIPIDWEVLKLEKYIKIFPGFPFDSKFFSDKDEGFPLIRIRDLERSYTETYYTGEYNNEFIVENNDLLTGMDGDFYVVLWKGKPGLLNQRICKINSINRQLDFGYLYYCLIGKIKLIQDSTPSTTVKHLSTKDIGSIKISFPPLKEQKQISEVLSVLDSEIGNKIQEKMKLEKLKKGLMQVLLTGKVRVKV